MSKDRMPLKSVVVAGCLALWTASPAIAGQAVPPAPAAAAAETPGAPADPADTLAARRNVLRVLTDTDYPPFNYVDETGQLTGFNIDFARGVCVELEVSCDIKAIAWADLLPTLDRGDGDVVIASIAATPGTLTQVEFSQPYYYMTAHFAQRKGGTPLEISPLGLESRKIAVAAGSAHEAYLKVFFPDSQVVALPSVDAARQALVKGQADVLFGDSLALAFWSNGTSSGGCCELAGNPYSDERYFGDGVSIAVRRGDAGLRRQLDAAILRIRQSNRYEELLSRYFPVRLF